MVALDSLASQLSPTVHQKRVDALLLALNDVDDSPDGSHVRFQYFPETVNDSKQVMWQPKEIPGGTLPLYQWMASGERLITFTAQFTCDVDLLVANHQITSRVDENRLRALENAGALDRNVDIRSAVAWLRRHTLPRFGDESQVGTPQIFAPRKLRLFLPNSGIGVAGGSESSGTGASRDSIVCIMTLCDVTYEAFFRSGLPRIATVNLAFAQVAQYAGQVKFPSRTSRMDEVVTTGAGFAAPYGSQQARTSVVES